MFICKWCNKTKEELNITNCGSHSRHCKLRPSETKPIIKRTRSPDEDILILRRKETLMLRMQDPEFKSQYLVKCRSTAKKKKDAGYVRPKCTDEAKAKIGMARKKFLAENPDKHPWKDKNKFKSVPCLKVKEFLKDNGIVFIEEFCPMPDRAFSIDIAFPDIKLGIEINGNQHYLSDGILAPYYKDRHDIIIASGWNLIELHYSCVYNNII